MEKIIITIAAVILAMGGMAVGSAVDSNSIVEDGIEYSIQTDKAVYSLGENVQMLYRVTNLSEDEVEFIFTYGPLDNTCDWMVDKDELRIWDNLGRPGTAVMTSFNLSPSTSYEYTHTWNMSYKNGDDILPGNYNVTGVLGYHPDHERYVPVSVQIEIIPEPAMIYYVDDDGPADFNNIQEAINDSNDGDTIIVQPGLYRENVKFLGKNIILTSTNPSDPNVVAATIIENTDHPAVKFSGTEDPSCMLIGFNINGTIDGLYYRTDPNGMPIRNHTRATISNCLISGNGACLAVIGFCDGTISNCLIADNFSTCGWLPVSTMNQCHGLIKNCTIVNNNPSDAVSVFMGTTTIENCIIYHNYAWWGVQPQVWVSKGGTLNISYSCVQGGLDGIYLDHSTATVDWGPGNIDADPCFVSLGYWDVNEVWVEGDYHLLAGSPCIDAGDPNYIAEPNETDLDGKPRVIGGRIDMGAYEYSPPIPADVRIVPRTINLASKGKSITCYIWLPEDYDVADVNSNSVLLEDEVEPQWLWCDEEEQVVMARFSRSEVQAILDIGEVELTITGRLTNGFAFEGTDVIRVIDKGRGK